MVLRKRTTVLALTFGTALLLAGCGYFGGLFSAPNSSEAGDIWIEAGAFSEPGLEPLALGGEPGAPKYIPGQLIVKFKEGKYSDQAVQALTERQGVRLKGRINPLRLTLVTLPTGTDLEAAKARLLAEPDVESVELNYVYELFAAPSLEPKHITNDPRMPLDQWGLFAIDFHKIAASVLPTSAPAIAVVDTGVDYTHPDLAGKVIKGPDYWDGDMDPRDTTGHGTHVAGIAAALTDNNVGVAGVSGKSQLLAIRVGAWEIPVFAGAAGIVYAADNTSVKVINLSWGGPFPFVAIFDAVQYATVTKGKIVVAAAGNDDSTVLMYPAAFPNVIAVGATDWAYWEGCPTYIGVRKACYSNYGEYVDIAAPGHAIWSTVPNNGYADWSGTSMAAPHVAGAAALLWGKWPSLTRDQVEQLLLSTVRLGIAPDECEGHEFPSWIGHLNVYNAFAARMAMPAAGGAILGLVIDANTGLPLSGATVTATSGTITRSASTRSDGTFTITSVPAGSCQITAARSGYVTTAEERAWDVIEGCWVCLPFIALPKTQASDVYTVVLEWRGWCDMGELDAYLWLPATLPPRNQYMVFWLDKGNFNVHPYARLLRDEPSQMPWRPWGPLFVETMTFRAKYPGLYVFAVNDYSGWGNWWCSEAVVRVYRGSSLVGTYNVCHAAGEGNWWRVFTVSGTTVTPVNQLTYDFPGPYAHDVFLAASQQKLPPADTGLPQGEYRYYGRK